jgi:hypothetical protein
MSCVLRLMSHVSCLMSYVKSSNIEDIERYAGYDIKPEC